MATIKKVRKAQDGWIERAACSRGICGKGSISDRKAARMDRREERKAAREEKSTSGERLDQKIMRGIGLATREGQENRQAARLERKNASNYKKGGKITKKPVMKKGGSVKKTMVKTSKKK